MVLRRQAAHARKESLPPAGSGGLPLTLEQIEDFLNSQQQRGRTAGTLEKYRSDMRLFYQALPREKTVGKETLARWQEQMLAEGYAPRTVNARISAINSLVSYLGRRDLQWIAPVETAEPARPALTRQEYLRLLHTARTLGKERSYLLVKLLGSTGLPVQELPTITVEAAAAGRTVIHTGSREQVVILPAYLSRELLRYAQRMGIASGPVFTTRSGHPLRRGNVSDSIKRLCRDAQVPEEKGTPLRLKELYQRTVDDIHATIQQMAEETYHQLLSTEQQTIGWEE